MGREEKVQVTLYLPRDMVRVIDRLGRERIQSRSGVLVWIIRRGLTRIAGERGRE